MEYAIDIDEYKLHFLVECTGMKKVHRYLIQCLLLACCVFVISVGLFIASGSTVDNSFDSSARSEDPSSHPFDQRPVLTQWRRIIPPVNSEARIQISTVYCVICQPEPCEILSLPVTVPAIISSYSCPPFRPRDPSVA